MPVPSELEGTIRAFGDVYRQAEARLNAELRSILDSPNEANRRRRIRELLGEINRRKADLVGEARAFLNNSLPTAWALGGAAAGAGDFQWTQIHRQALGLLAQDTFSHVATRLDGMGADIRANVRELAAGQARFKVATGQTARQAGRDLELRLRRTGVTAVTYRDGRHIRASTYTEMLMRTTTAVAYNEGGLNQMRQAGIRYVEGIDGGDCGLVTHDDGQKVNGNIFPIDVASAYTISHPNCRRDWAPRPDIVSDDQAEVTTSWRSPEQIADQVSFERYLAARADRATGGGRPARTPRTSTRSARAPRGRLSA